MRGDTKLFPTVATTIFLQGLDNFFMSMWAGQHTFVGTQASTDN